MHVFILDLEISKNATVCNCNSWAKFGRKVEIWTKLLIMDRQKISFWTTYFLCLFIAISQSIRWLLDVQVYKQMRFKFSCSLWTFTANIRLHIFMSHYMFLKVTTADEFLLTNVTCEPSTFIVWLQQMYLEVVKLSKTVRTVSTWVRLCSSVNVNMLLHFTASFKQLPTVTTVIRSSVAVYMTFMWLQIAGVTKTFVTQ